MAKGKEGLTAWDPIECLGLKVVPGGVGFYGGASAALIVEDELRAALVDGTWYATGYRVSVGHEPVPVPKRERIPAALWDVLTLSAETMTASGGGFEFIVVQIQMAERHDDIKRRRKML